MPNSDTASHAKIPEAFMKVVIEAFHLKAGGQTKLLFEQLKRNLV